MVDSESTTMPQVRQWARGAATELGGAPDVHCVMLMINCPGAGILGANAKSFLISFITNCLADFPCWFTRTGPMDRSAGQVCQILTR